MRYNKEEIDKIVTEIIIQKIIESSENMQKDLANKIIGKKSGEATAIALQTYYIESILNTKLIIVETLDKILSER
jgi:hypothetical protein